MHPNFFLILTPIDIPEGTPHEVVPGHFVARANEEQLKTLKWFLGSIGARFSKLLYEWGEDSFEGKKCSSERPKEEWRYWVINFVAESYEPERLGMAMHLVEPTIEICFDVFHVPTDHVEEGITGPLFRVFAGKRAAVFNFFDNPSLILDGAPQVLGKDYWARVANVFQRFDEIKSKFPEVWAAVQNFEDSKILPRASAMNVLALFAVMESLITHKPSESFNSLTHQISSKMPLLGKRFSPPLDYSHFSEQDPETVWKRLYDYRSVIAHGGTPNFKETKLKSLKGQSAILDFVTTAVRRLIAFSVRDPELISDLKKC